MNMKALKIIGLLTMTIDHVAVWLVPPGTVNLILRCIGRIAFPLFAFMIAEGSRRTGNRKKYWLRLLAISLVVEAALAVYSLISRETRMWENDIFLSLFLGLSALLLAKAPHWGLRLLVLPLLVLAYFLDISYGVFGMLFILLFGLLPTRPLQLGAAFLLLLATCEFPVYELFGTASPFADRIYGQGFEWFALLAFVPLFFYDGKRGNYSKWFFYAYYPAHLGIIVLIGEIIR